MCVSVYAKYHIVKLQQLESKEKDSSKFLKTTLSKVANFSTQKHFSLEFHNLRMLMNAVFPSHS